MNNKTLVITSIADDSHPILKRYAAEAKMRDVPFIVVGDTKSPPIFNMSDCDYYSITRQESLGLELSKKLPVKHYARKNIGYIVAIRNGAEVIVETDDDNIPLDGFWCHRSARQQVQTISHDGWVNIYKYYSDNHIWPRGFALEKILDTQPKLGNIKEVYCPIQQGLADDNPDVDAIYRLTQPLPITFKSRKAIALNNKSICPFNSQNTTWFKEAFPLLYLPSYCSFRMTDIWRSFIAQRIAWTCDWSILFHESTVRQKRNNHNLMNDLLDEISGYSGNLEIVSALSNMNLKHGVANIPENLTKCYKKLISLNFIGQQELELLNAWLIDIDLY